MQTLADEPQQRLIVDALSQLCHQFLAVDAVEERLDIGFQDPGDAVGDPVQCLDRVMGTAPRSIPV